MADQTAPTLDEFHALDSQRLALEAELADLRAELDRERELVEANARAYSDTLAQRDDFKAAALMYAATVDELRQHLDRANAHRDEQAQAISVYVGDVARLSGEVERLRDVAEEARAYEAAWTEFSRTPDANASDQWTRIRVAKARAHQALLDAVRASRTDGEASDG